MNELPPRLRPNEIGLGLSLGLGLGGFVNPAPPGFVLVTDTDGTPILDTDGSYIWEPV